MLMPFNPKFDFTYGEIKRYLFENGYMCSRADEIFGSVPIMSNVLGGILKAHFIIADLTDQNANVFYELGIAHSFKDPHNIILLSQSIKDIPFDIRHLNTIIYNEDNVKHLTASILKTIKDNSHYYSFFEALQKNSIIGSIHDDKIEFLETLQEHFVNNINVATDVLNGEASAYTERDIKDLLDACLGALYTKSAEGKRKQLKGIMRVLGALLCQCDDFGYAQEVANHFLNENRLESYQVDRKEIIFLQSELAVYLASNKVFFNDAMSWIIGYFSKSKSATVDLNRYNLERFLLTSDDITVDEIIVSSIFHENYYVREHMADIIGEKRINFGVESLMTQLSREENIYSTSSIITALGKLGDPKAYPSIESWFLRNRDKVLRTQHYFILKHIYLAVVNLKVSNDFTKSFRAEFAEYISPFAIF